MNYSRTEGVEDIRFWKKNPELLDLSLNSYNSGENGLSALEFLKKNCDTPCKF